MNIKSDYEMIEQMANHNAPLLQILLAVQDENPHKYISEEMVNEIARVLKITRCRVYSTASFYTEISLKPRGFHVIRICANAPCENAGKKAILSAIEQELGIHVGQTTEDGLITLEAVSCLGACYKSPAIKVDHEVYGNLSPEEAIAIIHSFKGGLSK